jgi:hypothetical protein
VVYFEVLLEALKNWQAFKTHFWPPHPASTQRGSPYKILLFQALQEEYQQLNKAIKSPELLVSLCEI